MYILLDVDLEPNSATLSMFFRVKQRKIPATGPITFTIEADNTLMTVTNIAGQAPYLKQDFAASQLAAVRIIEGPLGLAAEPDSVIVLAQRNTDLQSGFYVYFDTASGGSFSNMIGAVNGFASFATLQANVLTTDTTIAVTVPAQVDADGFSSTPGSLSAADNELLAVLVSYQTSGPDTGQITVDGNGYQTVEICSVSDQELVSGSNYTLTVTRGAFGTNIYAFNTANTEVWLIPKSAVFPLSHGGISQTRALGSPVYFRFTPWDSNGTFPLANATSEKFEYCNSLIQALVQCDLSAPLVAGSFIFSMNPAPAAINLTIPHATVTSPLSGHLTISTYLAKVLGVTFQIVNYSDSLGHTFANAQAQAGWTAQPFFNSLYAPTNLALAIWNTGIPYTYNTAGQWFQVTFKMSVLLANAGGISTDYYLTLKITLT